MFRITLEIDGWPVAPENFADELMRATYRSIEQGIVDQVGDLRCPVLTEQSLLKNPSAIRRVLGAKVTSDRERGRRLVVNSTTLP